MTSVWGAPSFLHCLQDDTMTLPDYEYYPTTYNELPRDFIAEIMDPLTLYGPIVNVPPLPDLYDNVSPNSPSSDWSSSPNSSPLYHPPRSDGSTPQSYLEAGPFPNKFPRSKSATHSQEEQHSGKNKKRKSESDPDSPTQGRKTIRPKVVEGKGVQCVGTNRKKKAQCRNAALMEYIGPRPLYCAEHIELDPESLYEKCKSEYQKEPGDRRNCKEVVLKEFGVCYKHFHDFANEMIQNNDLARCRQVHERISQLTLQLDAEAAAAKKVDGDLYQRKNKLLPKFMGMLKTSEQTLATLNGLAPAPF